MDLAFRLVESQTRAQDTDLSVKDLLAYNKIVRDAKTDSIEFTFWPMDILKGVLLAFGDSSFANVGKNRTSSQAGLIIMYAADREALSEKKFAYHLSSGSRIELNTWYVALLRRKRPH